MGGLGLFGVKNDPVREAILANRTLLTAAFGLSAVMSVLALTTSFYMLQVYDRVLSSRSVDTLILLTVMAIGGIATFSALDSLRGRLLMRIGMQVSERLSSSVLRAMVAASSQSGGVAMRSGLRDVETVRNFVGSPALGAVMDAPFILLYMVVLILLDPWLFAVVVVGAVILVCLALANQRLTNPGIGRALGLSARTHEFAEDGLRNADVLEGMGMSATFVSRWRRQWLESQRTNTSAADLDSRFSSMSKGVRMLIQIFLLGVGALLILDFKGTGGIMIGASIIGSRALAPIETLVSTWKSVIATRLAWARIVDLLEKAPRRDEGMRLPAPKGQLDVVSVSYVSRATGKPILQNVSFSLQPGESLGVIGPSASGKSTLMRLLTGAWPCTAGVVRLDGANIFAWPRGDLASYIGYLPQDVELFEGTVRENIARMSEGDPDVIVRAAQRARAHEMILALPKGYDTEVGGNGHRLSGGQSQRIGIARALYGDPKLVVLDEPNSNLDSMGEEALLASLVELKTIGATVIIVAHRPAVLANVDKMLVLKANGSVEAFGPRAEVMQRFTRRAPASNVVPLAHPGAPGPGMPEMTP
jgi:PrtD family type I secretion system ABC transporter